MAPSYPNHGRIDGPVVIIGFGSIGQGTLPLIERHFTYDPHQVHVIEPSDDHRTFLEQRGVHFIHHAVTRENCRALLAQLFPERPGLLREPVGRHQLARDHAALPRARACSTSTPSPSPGPGSTSTHRSDPSERTNYALRESLLAEKRAHPGGPTAVSLLRRQSGHGVVAA